MTAMKHLLQIFVLAVSVVAALLQGYSYPALNILLDAKYMPGRVNKSGYCFYEYADIDVYCETSQGSVIESRERQIIESSTVYIQQYTLGDFVASWGSPQWQGKGAYVNYLYWNKPPY